MTWYNQHTDCAKHKCGKIRAVELCEETFVGWLVGQDAVTSFHAVSTAGLARQGTNVKQACNLGHARVYYKFWAYFFWRLDPQERCNKNSKYFFYFVLFPLTERIVNFPFRQCPPCSWRLTRNGGFNLVPATAISN